MMPETKSKIVDEHGEHFTITKLPETGYAAPTVLRMGRNELSGYFDVSVPSYDNMRHWQFASPLHVHDAANRERRLRSRSQARYEVTNNCWLDGIVRTLASETIGDSGPMLQMSPEVPTGIRTSIERAWGQWSRMVHLAEKLWTGRRAKAIDGEVFYLFLTDNLLASDIKLQVRVIESDQVGAPYDDPDDEFHYDGVRIAPSGEPVEYHMYYNHPYQSGPWQQYPDGQWIYAGEEMVHLYDITRPGQLRGITELLPALSLAATLRRFRDATVHAAEKAADISLVMHTTASPDDEGCQKPFFGEYSPVPFERNMIVNLPYGWDAKQIQAEHPGNNYVEFVRQVVIEIGRAFNMPASVSLGDSSDYNYASGRLDFQQFARAIEIERRHQIETKLLEPLFRLWLQEYLALENNVSPRVEMSEAFPHQWYWQPRKTDDPEKNADAVTKLMEAGLMSDEEYWLEHGRDPDVQRAMIERQNEWRKKNQMPVPGLQPGMKPLNETGGSNETQPEESAE